MSYKVKLLTNLRGVSPSEIFSLVINNITYPNLTHKSVIEIDYSELVDIKVLQGRKTHFIQHPIEFGVVSSSLGEAPSKPSSPNAELIQKTLSEMEKARDELSLFIATLNTIKTERDIASTELTNLYKAIAEQQKELQALVQKSAHIEMQNTLALSNVNKANAKATELETGISKGAEVFNALLRHNQRICPPNTALQPTTPPQPYKHIFNSKFYHQMEQQTLITLLHRFYIGINKGG